MTHNETELLIKKYLNGETTADEERRLALGVSREGVPDDWKIIAGMLGELTVDEALFDQMMAECRQKPRIIKLWPWVAGIAASVLLALTLYTQHSEQPCLTPQSISRTKETPAWQYEDGGLDAYYTHQKEIQEKGERLAAYIQQQITINIE